MRLPKRPISSRDMETALQLYRGGLTIAEAAEAVGYSPATLYRIKREDAEWQALFAEARGMHLRLRGKLRQKPRRTESRPWRPAPRSTVIPLVGGPADGHAYAPAPPKSLECEGEMYRLVCEDGLLRYIADCAQDAFVELALRQWEREDELDRMGLADDEDCGL